jgi:hypothetical protein
MSKSIGYGVYDSFAVRFSSDTGEIWVCFNDDTWRVPSRPMQVYCYETAVLSEAEYHRLFDKYDLPPLPMHAFGGWRSPLV